jgi:hypothetical protein
LRRNHDQRNQIRRIFSVPVGNSIRESKVHKWNDISDREFNLEEGFIFRDRGDDGRLFGFADPAPQILSSG